jgi:MFS family permease
MNLLRRNRDFRCVFIAQVVSYLGDWFATVAILGLVVHETHSDAAASMVFVAQTLPGFLVAPIAGPAADRFNRRTLMVTVSVIQSMAAMTFLFAGHGHVWIAFVAQIVISALASFFTPSSQAALPNLVDESDLPTATTLMASTWGAMLAIGAAIGGAFTVAFGRQASFVADACSFALAAGLIISVRRPMNAPRHGSAVAATADELATELPAIETVPAAPVSMAATAPAADIPEPAPTSHVPPRMRPIADTRDALRYARGRPDILALFLSKMGFGLCSGVVGLLAAFADERFHAGDAGIGLLLAARGAGAFIGPLVARRIVAGRGAPAIIKGCGIAIAVFGVGYAIVPLAPALGLAAIAVFIAHLGGGTQWTLSTYWLQVATEDAFRGRIFAADNAIVQMTMSLSFLISGVASDHFGPRPVTAGIAAVALVWGGSYLLLSRGVRDRIGAAAVAAP